ncbi:nitrate reductase delta subunit [Virgibacillus natechei]|uniref:Nitrate reductase delta subunit n=1 Tax=Virgibacillus natechei TaxID=1216297 RepID=A0ABS4IG49_9BACI|nr:nitrate reductase molybdenum cofactor assembly chaperone [Virgibacillus natechei]MBP1969919.1 nitrate reductase delta subunit [Virgibacillus natechei]UZD13416.1 nitrate reductase molybdenum cofactor assembly chaperone [Virgibacillus natechei]
MIKQQEERAILVIASRLLGYPTAELVKDHQDINECVEENIETSELEIELVASYDPLFRLPSQEIQELYVATFDLKSKLGLYLTAHELGDSTKRGAALIKLQKIINQAGFEREGDELADYMPMLFEFLAVAPEAPNHDRLYRRLAVAIQRMLNNIDEGNPYAGILQVLMRYVFPEPTKEEVARLEFDREEADLEELPYPIMYQ